MAGNIFKWWRHKILGGYKQFSVLQECQSDSEDFIYQTRAPLSCSAPPDLLINSDPEGKNVKNAYKPPCKNNIKGFNHPNKDLNNQNHQMSSSPAKSTFRKENTEISNDSEDRVRLEEFTCDVSLQDDSKHQPLQFSFTLYDLDGHGKITKDDIAGIVSTIYESIGKSVIVPHYGSKTINVRLTVSPDAKTRSNIKNYCNNKNKIKRGSRRKLLSDDDEEHDNLSESSGERIKISQKEREKNRDCSTTTATDSANENHDLIINNKTRVCSNDTNDCLNNKLTNTKQNGLPSPPEDNCENSKMCPQRVILIDMDSCHNDDFKRNEINDFNVICKECGVQACPFDLAIQKSNKRKMLRKSRSRKQKYVGCENFKTRARSLSLGHENMRKLENRDGEQQCWKSPLKRHELIEIIRESMEKNRLCFQPNRKSIETPMQHRNRSHDVTSEVIDTINQGNVTPKYTNNRNAPLHKTNLCGYDSFLHATICTNSKNNVHLAASPIVINGPNRLTYHHKSRIRTKHNTNNASYHQITNQHPSRETEPMKLSTSLLSQLNPNLSAEQKMNRSINQVELWLETKDIREPHGNELKLMKNSFDSSTATETKCLNNNKVKAPQKLINIDNRRIDYSEQLKITEDDLVEIISPKKTFNKEILISSATRKQIKTHQNNESSTVTSPNKHLPSSDLKNIVLEYVPFPITADASECENLLLKDDDNIPEASQITTGTDNATTTSNNTPSTVHQYVHIHHHYHHFDAEGDE